MLYVTYYKTNFVHKMTYDRHLHIKLRGTRLENVCTPN